MKFAEFLQIGVAAFRAWVKVSWDAWGDVTGRALPYKAEDVAVPQVLSEFLNRWPVQDVGGDVRVTAVHRQDIPSVSSNCQNLVLTVEQAGDTRLPNSLFVKLPMESLLTRWFFSVINSWQLESHFFRHVASSVPLRTPVTYATHWQGSRFFLIQENLHEDPTVTLFTNPDMQQGPSLELVRRCLDAFARLHCAHYDLSRAEQEQILPLDFHLFLSSSMGTVSKALNGLALKPCMQKHPGMISERVAKAYALTQENWQALLEHWFAGPLSLLHGDSHLGNFFVSGDEMGMLDWQAAHWGKGIRDVQYFMVNSLPVETLAAHERELVNYYVERRAHYGTALDPELTWDEYRSLSYHPLMTLVVSVGFGALNEEQDVVMTEILRRTVAAVERLDYPAWLNDFLAADSSAADRGPHQ